MEGGGHDGGYRTAADCISAGMYWFSQSDLAAAEAWWRRALEIDPDNPRARACLRLLQRTSSTGFKSDSWARLPVSSQERPAEVTTDVFSDPAQTAARGPEASPRSLEATPEAFVSSPGREEAAPFRSSPGREEAAPFRSSPARAASDAQGPPSGTTGLGRFLEAAEASSTPDMNAGLGASTDWAPDDGVIRSPWDEGPSRTSVITVKSSGEFDAVADPTPLPEVDRERFFNRGDPSSRDEIVDFLQATGDLPAPDAPALGPSDPGSDPRGTAGLSEDLEGMSIQDAVSTEPATPVELSNPRAALRAARDRFQLHDFQGVLDVLDGYPAEAEAQTEVRNMIAESRANLLRMYEAKIGSLEQIPRVKVSSEEIIWLNLNHRAGFILSQVDGTVTYEDLVSLSGMPRLDTVRILTELLDQNVIGT